MKIRHQPHENAPSSASNALEGVATRILRLRNEQIGALLNLAGLDFNTQDINDVVVEIRTNGLKSGHLPILLSEAKSKDALLWWISFFEEHNK